MSSGRAVTGSIAPSRRGSRSLSNVVGRLTTVNAAITAVAFLTGPLQARALGPAGRGDLAAIALPLGFAPMILGAGLGTYVMRESALRRRLPVLLGSVGVLLIGVGLLAAFAAPEIANLFAGGRTVVHTYVLIGFLLMPVSMLSWLLSDFATGLERWDLLVAMKLSTPVLTALALVALFVTRHLTVGTAAAVTLTAGLLSLVPVLPLLRQIGRPRFDRRVAAESIPFGAKAWLGGIGSLVNFRLDQLLMTRMVAPRELGLYVVAVTVSMFCISPVLSALTSGLTPRFAREGFAGLPQLLRTTLLGVTCVGAVVAIFTPIALPILFGRAFIGAVPMVMVLVAATIPLAGSNVLSTALTTSGRPGYSARSELVGIAVTVPGLIIVLPRFGGIGAAFVSLAAYSASFIVLLIGSKRQVAVPWHDLVLPRRSDVICLAERLRRTRAVRLMRAGFRRPLAPRPTPSSPRAEKW